MPSLRSHTHLQATQANAQSKACLPSSAVKATIVPHKMRPVKMQSKVIK